MLPPDTLTLDFGSFTTNPNITIPDNFRFLQTSVLEFPTGSLPAGASFRGNINARISAIPEPDVACILACVAVWTAGRRRKLKGQTKVSGQDKDSC